MSEPLVSIIIPVYNVEAYLRECLNSVVTQTYQNLEIICVNDGSTDDSFIILEEFAQQDARIRVVNQVNQGLSCARNAGTNVATGEYIYFLDSDDAIYAELIERCLETLANHTVDIVTFDAEVINELGQAVRERYSRENILPKNKVLSGVDFLAIESKVSLQTSVPTYFFKHNVLRQNNLAFYPQMTHEDVLFHFQLLALKSIKIFYLSERLYRRRMRADSIMTTKFSIRNIEGYLRVYKELFKDKSNLALKKRYCQPICSRFIRELLRPGYSFGFRLMLMKSIYKCCMIGKVLPLPFMNW